VQEKIEALAEEITGDMLHDTADNCGLFTASPQGQRIT
jgi:hypothetical protein